jgi:hypothetical protein
MQSIREQRRDQMFPKLDPVEIERVDPSQPDLRVL